MEKSPYAGVRRFVLANMIIVPVIPFLIVIAIGYHHFSESIENSTIASMKRIAGDHRQMIASFLEERQNDLELIANTVSFDELVRPERLSSVFTQLQRTSSAFSDLGIFDENGVHIAYHGPFNLTGKLYRDASWFQETLKKGVYISDVFLGYRNIPHFIIAVAGIHGGRPWILRATVDSQRFNNLVRQVRIGKTGEAYLLNSQGTLQTIRRSGGELMEQPAENIPVPPRDDGIHTLIHGEEGHETFLYATAWLKGQQWLLVVRQAQSDAFSALRASWLPVALISLIGGACIVWAAFTLTGAVVRKMEKTDSEKALLSQQLVGASRLAELGEMAAGFAHEINNPLQVINTELSLIRVLQAEMVEAGHLLKNENYDQIADSMDQIKVQIERCSRITRSILKFGRQDAGRDEVVVLDKIVPEIIGMVEKKAQVHGIRIDTRLPDRSVMIQADPSRLQQVLLNLFNNAIDAIIEKSGSTGGLIKVVVREDGTGTAAIDVSDTGTGIAPENMDKIFTPFFTTKPVGKGTGL
ncbi:MAG TPA: cache domain-containing protein, partial [Desulfosarcina sp.]|nr:cache domain-containing protein [Desulfosarcina sp.]